MSTYLFHKFLVKLIHLSTFCPLVSDLSIYSDTLYLQQLIIALEKVKESTYMELVIVTGFVLIIIGFYWGMKYGRRVRKIKAKRSYQVCLMADEIEWSHPHLHCIIFAFDRSGHLVRKFPEAEMKLSKGKYMLYCIVEEGFLNFCVLFVPHALSLSGVSCREDIDRLFGDVSGMQIAETGVWEVERNAVLPLYPVNTLDIN